MTDQGGSLSRRARREAEARRAAPDQPTTPIPSAAGPLTNPDGTPLSRRQRRELERQTQPIETWTVEEELIATGQVPAMTPEALAQQELVERSRTEEPAAQDAPVDDAVAEPVGEPEPATFAEPEPEPARAPEPEPVAEAEADAEAVAEPEPVAEPAPQPEEPWPAYVAPQAAQPEPEPEPEVVQESEPERAAEQTQPLGGEEDAEAIEPEPVSTETGGIEGIPEEYRHLFPPGSLQARRLQESGERAPEPEAEVEPAAAVAQPEVAPAPLAEERAEDPAEEIRRLTAAAMAGITRAQEAQRRAPEAEPAPAPAEVYAAEEAAAPAAGVDDVDEDEAEGFDGPEFSDAASYEPSVEADGDGGLPQRGLARTSLLAQQPAPEPAVVPEEDEEPAEAPASEETTTAAVTTPGGGAPIVPAGLRPATTAAAAEPTVWESHPLASAQTREVGDYTPADDIPIPDFTKIMHGYASTASSAGTSPGGHVGDEPSATELPADAAPIRPQPEETEEGAHHFAWAHLAVIGAIAFLLGVLVWHLTGNAG